MDMLLNDAALSQASDDELGRKRFCEVLGEHIAATLTSKSIQLTESAVLALNGPWGCGKTSILNLALATVEQKTTGCPAEEKPIVVRFNPWYFTDQNQLLDMFFRELAKELSITANSEELKGVANRLDGYATMLKPLKWMAGIALPAVAGPIVAKIATEQIDGVSDFVKIITTTIKGAAATESKGLHATRSDIDAAMGKSKQRVLVVIDDIDRLSKSEVRLMFQLIKLTANFPNTVYLLSFDRVPVEAALGEGASISNYGHEFLKKIVQVAYDVPSIETVRLKRFLIARLSSMFPEVLEDGWNRKRIEELWNRVLVDTIKTIRDAKKYLNGLNLGYGLVRPHVDPVDFLSLEVVRVFFPEFYQSLLWGLAKELAYDGDRENYFDNENDLREKWVKKILDKAKGISEAQRAVVEELVYMLFPHLEGKDVSIDDELGRIYLRWHIERFFILSLPQDEMSEEDVRAVCDLAGSEKFAHAADELESLGKVNSFIEGVVKLACDQAFETRSCEPLVLSLYAVSNKLGFEDGFSYNKFDAMMYRLIQCVKPDRLKPFLECCFMEDHIVGYSCDFLDLLNGGQRKQRRLISEDLNTSLRKMLATGIIQLWEDERLCLIPRAGILINFLKQESPARFQELLEESIRTEDGFLKLLGSFIEPCSETYAWEEDDPHSFFTSDQRINYRLLIDSIDPIKLEDRLNKIPLLTQMNNNLIGLYRAAKDHHEEFFPSNDEQTESAQAMPKEHTPAGEVF